MKRYTACPVCEQMPSTATVTVRFSSCSPGTMAPNVWEPGDKLRLTTEQGPRTDDHYHSAWYNERNRGYALACAVREKVG